MVISYIFSQTLCSFKCFLSYIAYLFICWKVGTGHAGPGEDNLQESVLAFHHHVVLGTELRTAGLPANTIPC